MRRRAACDRQGHEVDRLGGLLQLGDTDRRCYQSIADRCHSIIELQVKDSTAAEFAIAADINNYNSSAKRPDENKKGIIYMRFKNYVVNRGIEHSLVSDGGVTFVEAMAPVPRDHVPNPERDLVLGELGGTLHVER